MVERGGDDLADTLANMAGDEAEQSPTRSERPADPIAARPRPAARVQVDPDEEEIEGEVEAEIDAEIEEDEGDGFDELHESIPTGPARTPFRKPKRQDSGVKEFGAPILLTVGLLLLIPTIWAIMILRGSESAWGADREDAAGMAKLMLVCAPIALVLLASAVYLFVDIARTAAKKKRERG